MLRQRLLRFAVAFATLAVVACGKPTVEGAQQRYKTAKDKLELLANDSPNQSALIRTKLAEFEAEFAAANGESDDEARIKKLNALSSRMETFIREVDPKAGQAQQGGADAPSNKLDGESAGGGKLDGEPQAGGGKLDGGAPPADAPSGGLGAPPAGGQPAGGGGDGMGGL